MSPVAAGPTVPKATVALFGKVPTVLDFVRVEHTHPLGIQFDSWLQAANQTLAQSGADWPAERVRFLYAPPQQMSCLVGMLAPSRDRAGRRFPLAVYAVVQRSALSLYVPAVPLACGRQMGEIESLLALASTAPREQLAQRLADIQPVTLREVEERHVELTRKLCTWGARQFMSDLFSMETPDQPERALLALMRATRVTPGVALSLVADLPVREPLHLAAWLAMLARRGGGRIALPSLFWIEGPSTARSLLCFGPPPPHVPLWLADGSRKSDRLLRLDAPPRAPISAELLQDVAIDGSTLQQLFDRLARVRITP